ncbi:MAG: hypothetical protein HY961_08485 [Ignavibacteriae bacterium]|nr:hypothetical protein [Ignavibacteriota bacterium]
MATRRLRVIAPFRQLQSTAAVRELTRVFLAKQILPRSAANDAAHIAIAAVHELDYILTWNLAHIANGEILKRVVAACAEQGYHCPIVCTPDELMGM